MISPAWEKGKLVCPLVVTVFSEEVVECIHIQHSQLHTKNNIFSNRKVIP